MEFNCPKETRKRQKDPATVTENDDARTRTVQISYSDNTQNRGMPHFFVHYFAPGSCVAVPALVSSRNFVGTRDNQDERHPRRRPSQDTTDYN